MKDICQCLRIVRKLIKIAIFIQDVYVGKMYVTYEDVRVVTGNNFDEVLG